MRTQRWPLSLVVPTLAIIGLGLLAGTLSAAPSGVASRPLPSAIEGAAGEASGLVSGEGSPAFTLPRDRSGAAAITVSGTISGPSGPAGDVWIGVGSEQDWIETTTDSGGFYSVSVQTDGQLHFHVRPTVDTRLTQINLWMDGVAASFTQSFSVTEGHLLSLQLTGSGGLPITGNTWFDVRSLIDQLPDNQWYELVWDEPAQRYRAVLPPDVYYVTALDVPSGYYRTTQAFDLRAADLVAGLSLDTAYTHPIPYDPPDATRITIGPVDGLGEATVTGTAGAALPLAYVLLVNLNSTHQAHAVSQADGSFVARIYAPPGSAVLVKHGPPAQGRWNDLDVGIAEGVNPFPGTIINVPHTHAGDLYSTPFAAAGAIDYMADDPNNTRNYVSSAWAITGTIGPVVVEGQWTRILTGTYDSRIVPGLYLGGLNWTHPALGDLDGDNDLDLLVGERSGHLVLYRNARNQVFQKKPGFYLSPDWQFETAEYAGVNTGGWAYPALADVTNDGALDLFVGAGDGTVAIYYNIGTSTAPIWPTSPDASLSVGYQAAPALDDLDGDGLLDLLVGHQGGTLTHFKNTGTLTNPIWALQTTNYGGISESGDGLQPAFVDLDGDADLDLLVGLCGQMIWYERDGTPPTWTRHDTDPIGYGGGSCATSPGIGDWSGDGANDVVTGEHWGNLRFFRSDGPSSWTVQEFSFPFDLEGDSAPALADWDGDGDPDLLMGQAHGQVLQYTNVSTDSSPDWRPDGVLLELPWTNHPHAYPAFADIDGDDDYDLFIGEGGWQGPGAGGNIHYYVNDGSSTTPSWTLVTTSFLGIDVGGWSTPVFVDIDADADLDLFIGDEEGTLTFVENTGTITTPTWNGPVQPYAGLDLGSYSAPSFFDVNQDGKLDMLVGLENGSLAYVRNTGTPTSPAWELVATAYPGINVGHHATPSAADINGDGKADLPVGDGDGGLNIFAYDGPGMPPATGTLYLPNDLLQIEGSVHLYSPAITSTTDVDAISVDGWVALMMLFDQKGQPLAAENYFMSTFLTPSGFPIQRNERATEWLNLHLNADNLRYIGGHTIGGDLSLTTEIPDGLLPGIYRPVIYFDFTGVPTSTDWLAANVTQYTYSAHEALLPPIQIGQIDDPSHNRLIWRLLMDDFVQGTRGTGAREDRGTFELASQIVSQGAPYYTPPVDVRTGEPITYRLEPFLPMISFTDRRLPAPPLLPFELPGGQLRVTIREPDGTVRDLGSEPFAQSFNRTKTTRAGNDLNSGTVQLEDVYSLKADSNRFRVTFDQYGRHVITMTGTVDDIWGNSYVGGGTYDVWIAHPLDIDPGVLPGTPLAVGDAFNPAMQFYPRVPADVRLAVTLYPDSDPAQALTHTLTGQANLYGYFSPIYQSTNLPITLTAPGEYRVDLTAVYTDASGEIYMGTMTWGGVVMTPKEEANLIAHGRRGVDTLASIPGNAWFVFCRDLPIRPGDISHTLNPYHNGDIIWSRMVDSPGECPEGISSGGDSLVLGASVHDATGAIEATIEARANRVYPPITPPGDLSERLGAGEIPLFSSTRSGRAVQMEPDDADQIAYSYRYSQRPGVRVREVVAEDGQTGGYWRLDTLYDDQLSVGVQGDQPNDFKFQYVGTVYRDLDSGHSEYGGQGSGWIFIPDDDLLGSRVMPPFAGFDGWPDEGGPILILKGKDIHMFILPTGTPPGAVLRLGDTFRFAGHIMPTLSSSTTVTVTAPSGAQHLIKGQANDVGYFYDPDDDFSVNEPGLWTVDVHVWHDGLLSGGATSPPFPSGGVLGSEDGRYWFYVVSHTSPRLDVSSPVMGFLSFEDTVTPITITGAVTESLSTFTVDYTISMPGYILEHGRVTDTYEITFDPAALHDDFQNLDLTGRDEWRPGLSDTFAIGLLLQGESENGTIYQANTITIQGEEVFIGNVPPGPLPDRGNDVYLPLVLRSQATQQQ